jgi:hypothetical protein
MFQIKHYLLPHDGVMPGARGLKKVVVPKGTRVYCIVYGTLVYWCTFLHEAEAIRAKQGLEDTVNGLNKRTIDLNSLLAWNFKSSIPKRVFRSAEYRT